MQKIKYKGKLISLITKRIRLPNGYIGDFEIVRHPGAALIIPFLDKNKIIMLRQFRPVVNAYLYELPAGTLNKNESELVCAKREIIEETGYSAKKLSILGKIYPVPGYSTEKIIIYKAEGLKKQKRNTEKDEVLKSFIFDKKKIKKLFKSAKLIDAKTICALSLCGWL